MTPDMTTKVQLWRQKARDGTLTQEEMREAIAALRADRATIGAAKGKRTTTKKNINSDDLLNELDNL